MTIVTETQLFLFMRNFPKKNSQSLQRQILHHCRVSCCNNIYKKERDVRDRGRGTGRERERETDSGQRKKYSEIEL